jgi:DNA recombination protein RmuC
MTDQQLLFALAAVAGLNLVLLIVVLVRQSGKSAADAIETLGKELRTQREDAAAAARDLRADLAASQKDGFERLLLILGQLGKTQTDKLADVASQIKEMSESNTAAIDKTRLIIDARLKELQEGNEKKLEQMRHTVDEKLQGTLEKRLGESFKLVSERLEAVQQGLGEMRNLATGVGDLKKVLTNVKSRGTWGEVQLGALLEQILTPEQFDRNVQTKTGSAEVVEFAIRLPGPEDDKDSQVWLPIDAKFPQEDYLRLVEASEAGDAVLVQQAIAALVRSVQNSARDISSKYLNPPRTTDFAILFLPTEGLYAEALRQPGLIEKLQNEYRIVVAGPTTLAAILNSLRMGFKTLAIEKRSSEVWKVLSAVKTEFGKFGVVLDKVGKQLDTARKTIDQTGVRTRAIERKLSSVEALPVGSAADILSLAGVDDSEEVGEGDEDDSED